MSVHQSSQYINNVHEESVYTAIITQTEFDQAEDRHELLRSKGIPMVRDNNGWVFDPDYIVDIEMVKKVGTPETKYRYYWSMARDDH